MEIERTLNEEGKLEREALQRICGIIQDYNLKISDNLEFIVSTLCDVDVKEMMTDTKKVYNVQARWLYWYAQRYMTNESYASISRRTIYERKFTVAAICFAINRMSDLISANTIWTKRWVILKRIIKESLYVNSLDDEIIKRDIKIKITHPRGVNIELKEE